MLAIVAARSGSTAGGALLQLVNNKNIDIPAIGFMSIKQIVAWKAKRAAESTA